MPLLMNRAVLLAKTETTYGTDATPTGAANAILVRNLSVNANVQDLVGRSVVRPFLGGDEQIVAGNHVECSFEVELQGSGTAGTAPGFGPLLQACALSQTIAAGTSVTYAPVSTAFSSVTIVYNIDGVNHKLTGCYGTADLVLTAKDIPVIRFNFTGMYNTVTDTTITGASFTLFKTPLAVNKENTPTVSLFTKSVILQSATISLGMSVAYRNLVGSESIVITDRSVTGTLVFEAPRVTEFDVFAAVKAGTLGAFSLTHGTAAGLRCAITSSNVQLTSPQYSDQDGIAMLQVSSLMLPGTAGNDEISIAFT